MNAIELSHVNKQFDQFSIRDLSLTIPMGTICGLVGENGAGKSTTIRLLMNALAPDSGSIRVLGTNPASPEFLATKEDIGVVLDEAYFPESLTASQVGKLMNMTYHRWNQQTYEAYLGRFNLPRKQRFKDFSRGMRMKLAISIALSHEAKLLILDEATAGLDPVVRDEVLDIFNDFTRDETHSILISSHILSDLEKLCDHIAFLHQGVLLFCEEKDRLLETYSIFKGTREQLDSLQSGAVVGWEALGCGGVRALVKRSEVPASLLLERATVEDTILFLVKGARQL